MNTRIVKTISLFLVMAGMLHGQGLLPKLGEQRAGTASLTFLKIGVGARAVSMGGAYVAMANDVSSMYWNPAGLAQIGHHELMVSHLDWLVDIDLEYLGYVHQVGSQVAIGTFVEFLHMADMPVTTEYNPYGNGTYFQYSDLSTGISTSIRMTDKFSFGVTLKYVRENLADLIMDGFMVDIGTYYWTGFRTLRIAAAMRNFGPELRPDGSYERKEIDGSIKDTQYESFSPPTVFTLGVAMAVLENEAKTHVVTGTLQMNHPMDDAENYILGAEYLWRNLLSLRSGYRMNSEVSPLSFGTGLMLKVAGKRFKFDYSYSDYEFLNDTQQISFGFEF